MKNLHLFSNGKDEKDNYKAAPIPERLKKNKRIAILTDNKVEDIELFYPYYRFNEDGYEVDIITLNGGSFKGKMGIGLKESKSIDEVLPESYELLYLPGGDAPQTLAKSEKVVNFIKEFAKTNKPIAAICHGSYLLIAANLVKGKKISAWPEIKDKVENAGAAFADEALQIDEQLITARKPGDLHRHLCGIMDRLKNNP